MAAPIVVFDLDGTLVDTAPDLVDTLNVIFAREGLPPVAYEAARNMIGGGARLMIERGLAAEGRHLHRRARSTGCSADFIAHYAAHIADRSRPFPDLEDALDELAARGCRFAVCTNKLEVAVAPPARCARAHASDSRRSAARTRSACRNPARRPLRRTIGRLGGRLDDAVMVGDSGTDIATARAAGIPVVAVDFGYSETPIREFAPDRIISSFAAPARHSLRPS